jgi:hypothetical protein
MTSKVMIGATMGSTPTGQFRVSVAERPSDPAPLKAGYGVCSNRMVCHCTGYRGMNNQPCQACGCGFGAHY